MVTLWLDRACDEGLPMCGPVMRGVGLRVG